MPRSTRIDEGHQAPVNDYHTLSDDVRSSKMGKKSQPPPGSFNYRKMRSKEESSEIWFTQTPTRLFECFESPTIEKKNEIDRKKFVALKQLLCYYFDYNFFSVK